MREWPVVFDLLVSRAIHGVMRMALAVGIRLMVSAKGGASGKV